jgi:2-phospho-L-lactate guanylyltransferase (CobY/MobA/RfbA family)
VIKPSFGPGSFERHRALALEAGLRCRVERPSSLLLDIDTGADLAALRERLTADRPGSRSARASRTRAVLDAADGVVPLPLTTSA